MLERFSFSELTIGFLKEIVELALMGCKLLILFYSIMSNFSITAGKL